MGTALIRDNQPARGQVLVNRILREEGESAEARLLLGATKNERAGVRRSPGRSQESRRTQSQPSRCVLLLRHGPHGDRRHRRGGRGIPQRAGDRESQRFRLQPAIGQSHLQTGSEVYDDARSSFERALRVRPGDPVRSLPIGHPGPDDGQCRTGVLQTGAARQRDASIRRGACLFGDRLLSPQTQGGR